MNLGKRKSLLSLIGVCLVILLYRGSNIRREEIAWDVLGYHMYLPATFIQHDPFLNDISWFEKARTERQLAGTSYMLTYNKEGKPMYFFLMGMALFYLPFFLFARVYDSWFHLIPDPYSWHDQVFLAAGFMIYTCIAFIYLRKVLLQYFSDGITAIVSPIILISTNAIHHLTIKNLETVNVLFMLCTLVIWHTIKWKSTSQSKYFYYASLFSILMCLIKPSEIFIFLIPLLWGVKSVKDIKSHISFLLNDKKTIGLIFLTGFILAAPQMFYWHHMTGKWIYDSYVNPGIGLDLLSPHIGNILFSARKGWLLYTPVMIFAIVGFYPLKKNLPEIFTAAIIYFLVSFYIISSWTEWWYGAAYSVRPLIVTYPILAISMSAFFTWIGRRVAVLTGTLIVLFTLLNLFQYWQLNHWILDPYRTTWSYYKAIFLKTEIPQEAEKIKLVKREFDGTQELTNPENYERVEISQASLPLTFIHEKTFIQGKEFTEIFLNPFESLTEKDHCWLEINYEYLIPSETKGEVFLVISMENKSGSYGYQATELKSRGSISSQKVFYLTPEIRNRKDHLKVYIWNKSGSGFMIQKLKMSCLKPLAD